MMLVENPFKCPKCFKEFQKKELEHMEKPYKCSNCSEEFPKKELERHFIDYHMWG